MKKALKRALSENYYLGQLCQKCNVNEDKLFEDLMHMYMVDIRKSLMACLIRVLGIDFPSSNLTSKSFRLGLTSYNTHSTLHRPT